MDEVKEQDLLARRREKGHALQKKVSEILIHAALPENPNRIVGKPITFYVFPKEDVKIKDFPPITFSGTVSRVTVLGERVFIDSDLDFSGLVVRRSQYQLTWDLEKGWAVLYGENNVLQESSVRGYPIIGS
ncbi:MAG: hypothetical protein PHP25_01590 [Candidatus Moranbacteria bacterium]|nr:hypothetical protein [Candidatus Moranbacteria bacterium]